MIRGRGTLMRGKHLGFALATGLAFLVAFSQAGIAGPALEAGEYADLDVGDADSDLRFTLNPAATKIKPGASLQGGFECAKRTVFARAKVPINENRFSFKGPVESATGKPKGTLRWSGEWTAADKVSGKIRLKKDDCSSGKVPWEAALPPGVPSGLTATTSSDTQISLEWDAAVHVDRYVIARAQTSGGPYTDIQTTTDTSFQDSGLDDDTSYFYIVRGVNPAGESAQSAEATAKTLATCVDNGADNTPGGATNLGNVPGDIGSTAVAANATICPGDVDWYRVNVTEQSDSSIALTARADLQMGAAFPAGDLDLARYCHSSASIPMTSTNPGTATETIFSGRSDEIGDGSYVLFFEVDGFGAAQNAYQLTITGNVATADTSCNGSPP
jgi:hypothetical protein